MRKSPFDKSSFARAAQRMARNRNRELGQASQPQTSPQQKVIAELKQKVDGLEQRLATLEARLVAQQRKLDRVNSVMETNFSRLHPNATILSVQ
jgi:flagellar motility protein MotE (MotC chaperone)